MTYFFPFFPKVLLLLKNFASYGRVYGFVLFSFFSWSVVQESMSFFSFAFYSSLFPFVSSGDLLTRNWKFWSAASGWNLLSLIFSKKFCLSDKFGSDLRTRS